MTSEHAPVEQLVLFEFAFSEPGCEVRTVNRDVELLEQVRQRAEMIFVTVREDDRADEPPFQIADVREEQIDA